MTLKRRTVADVMTSRVHVASPTTPFKMLVRLIEDNRVSAIPVVDQGGIPVGLVSASDLMLKERRFELDSESSLLHPRHRHADRVKADGVVATDVMTSPVITIGGDATLADAARQMQKRTVHRLVVVDDRGKIAGIVSRSDLLQVFLRSDEELLGEIVDGVIPTLMLSSELIGVSVQDNVVTLHGQVDRKTDVVILERWTKQLDGVVDVVNHLTYRWDDRTPSQMPAF